MEWNRFNSNVEEIRNYLEVDSLEYLTVEEMLQSMTDHKKDDFCTACFSGDYPISVDEYFKKNQYED
ncbi:MAG: glutamine phosphoribosylpyrophosphate [Ignavibacteria bacterium]|nr:MAG: glutamine phosphoribosylpyrophosphate [Ignavibacteria bacterium]